jgi:dTDP-4-amino-4,6-dideoxygalactose transaminase
MPDADVHSLAAPAIADPGKAARTARSARTAQRPRTSRGDGLPVRGCRQADTPLHVDFSPPAIGEAEIQEVTAALRSGWLSTGPRVARFEREFAEYVHAPYAVAVNSCTAALHLSLLAAGVGPGDEVITTPLTFCSTANVIVHTGATPVFADIDPSTWNLEPAAAAAALTPRTRVLLPVDFAGRRIDAAGFARLARRAGLTVVEDAAHCVEGVGRGAAPPSDFTCFSFYATKNLTTGEGGMVVTTSREKAEYMRLASLHGMSRDAWARYSLQGPAGYDVVMAGFKYNMSDLLAAIGLHQLATLEHRLARREQIWQQYNAGLAGLPLVLPSEDRAAHARHLYTILVDEARCGWSRDALQAELTKRGISTSVHFKAVHLHSYYATRFGFRRGMFPVAEFISDRTLSLPLSPALSDEDVARTIEAIITCLR